MPTKPRTWQWRPPRPKNHEVYSVYDHGYIGKTWCGRRIMRSDHDDPWTTERKEEITGHRDDCGNCRHAKAMNQPWGERKPPSGVRHKVKPVIPGYGRTWCGRNVTAGGSRRPWTFRDGRSATDGDRDCRVCNAAKAADERRRAARLRKDNPPPATPGTAEPDDTGGDRA